MPSFSYRWRLADGYGQANGPIVLGTFLCGGGSTMGYKLAGFNHLGGVEIDPQMAAVYKANHHPKRFYNEDIRAFNDRADLPDELFNLDLLDGSPPCSTFSTAGSREAAWGKQKRFREGQSVQVLDDLVYVYCDTIIKLRPKAFVLENVTGILKGNAKSYTSGIVKKMASHGYTTQVFQLNAATMGVPQRRERVFFIGQRMGWQPLKMAFNERPVPYSEVEDDNHENAPRNCDLPFLPLCVPGKSLSTVHPKSSFFNSKKLAADKVAPTVCSGSSLYHYKKQKQLSNKELALIGSFPEDYSYLDCEPKYLIGMSVPPVMVAQIASQLRLQWFDKHLSQKTEQNQPLVV